MTKKSQEGGTNATQYDHIWLRFNQSKGHIWSLRAACKFMRLDNSSNAGNASNSLQLPLQVAGCKNRSIAYCLQSCRGDSGWVSECVWRGEERVGRGRGRRRRGRGRVRGRGREREEGKQEVGEEGGGKEGAGWGGGKKMEGEGGKGMEVGREKISRHSNEVLTQNSALAALSTIPMLTRPPCTDPVHVRTNVSPLTGVGKHGALSDNTNPNNTLRFRAFFTACEDTRKLLSHRLKNPLPNTKPWPIIPQLTRRVLCYRTPWQHYNNQPTYPTAHSGHTCGNTAKSKQEFPQNPCKTAVTNGCPDMSELTCSLSVQPGWLPPSSYLRRPMRSTVQIHNSLKLNSPSSLYSDADCKLKIATSDLHVR